MQKRSTKLLNGAFGEYPCFCATIRHAARAVTRVYEEEYRQVGITGPQYGLLRILNRNTAMRQRDLGDLIGLDETTLTRTLRPMKTKGWIAFAEGTDRREKLITLTAGGRRQCELAFPAWERAQERVRKQIPSKLWDAMMESLPQVTQATTEA